MVPPATSLKIFSFHKLAIFCCFRAYFSDFGGDFRPEIALLRPKIARICYNMVLENYYRDLYKNQFLFNKGVCPVCDLLLIWQIKWKRLVLTLIGVQGYSGQVEATAKAPSILVWSDKPTKNSRPVKRTSDPDNKADGDQRGSTIAWFSSFLRTDRIVSTSIWRTLLEDLPSLEAEGRHIRAIPLTTTLKEKKGSL